MTTSPNPPSFNTGKFYTDVTAPRFALYIEGVEVPFVAMSISSGKGTLPSAVIEVPPAPALLDIGIGYAPKVHIFFYDEIGDLNQWRLIFCGFIKGSGYSKSSNPYSQSTSIQFYCGHKYALIEDLTVDFSGYIGAAAGVSPGVVRPALPKDTSGILLALQGVSPNNPAMEVTVPNQAMDPPAGKAFILPSFLTSFQNRLLGITGILVNYWQQLKATTFMPGMLNNSSSFVNMYMPLVEQGISFFQRMTGHTYLEAQVEAGRQAYNCKGTADGIVNVVIPPVHNLFMMNAISTDMSVRVLRDFLAPTGVMTNLYQIYSGLLEAIDYELITLTSPAESGNLLGGLTGQTYAADTIVKPKLPFYYSPSCNIVLPGMIYNLSFNSDDSAIPSRIEFKNDESPNGDQSSPLNTYYRSPPSVREVLATTAVPPSAPQPSTSQPPVWPKIADSLGPNNGKYGLYEQGHGIRVERGLIPKWLSLLSGTLGASGPEDPSGVWPSPNAPAGSLEEFNYNSLLELSTAWINRNGVPGLPAGAPGQVDQGMNPWAPGNGLRMDQRMLFSAVDYFYTEYVVRAKAGTVIGPFNPYIIPGYPMDIIGGSPVSPSFHALCSSVTHSITTNSCETSISFTAALSYSQMANYYVPFVNPWLQVTLGLATNPTIINNPRGKVQAINFYNQVLGQYVNAVAPDDIYDFATGLPAPLKRDSSLLVTPGGSATSVTGPNGGEGNPNLSLQGNLSLVFREIESMEQIQTREGITFIPMIPANYNSAVFQYNSQAPIKTNPDGSAYQGSKLELGQSPFLTYGADPHNPNLPGPAPTSPIVKS